MKTLAALFILAGTMLVWIGGYDAGKHAADRWYARNIPCSTHCLTYPVQNEGVTLIQPIRVRTAAPVANLQEPKPSFEIHTGPVSNGINGFECSAPVASVEEPR